MSTLDGQDLWRQIPPEEKFELMSKSHAKGIQAGAVTVIVGCTVAVALKVQVLIWLSIILSPLIFQFAAGKAWRDLRPRIMLEYLAARSATRRYAFSIRGKDLTLLMLFKGKMEEEFDEEHLEDSLEAKAQGTDSTPVWVGLFRDSIVMMSERMGGGELRFGQLLTEKRLRIEGGSLSGESEYSNDHFVRFTFPDRSGSDRHVRLTSKYPGALIVFEKKLLALRQQVLSEAPAEALPPPAEGTDDMFQGSSWDQMAQMTQ